MKPRVNGRLRDHRHREYGYKEVGEEIMKFVVTLKVFKEVGRFYMWRRRRGKKVMVFT